MVEAKTVTMQVATRSVPSFDPASFMIWGVGVLTCLIACSLSAEAERRKQQGMKFEDEPFALAFGPSQSDNVSIDSGIAVGFMMFASFALLALFFAFKYAPSFTLQVPRRNNGHWQRNGRDSRREGSCACGVEG